MEPHACSRRMDAYNSVDPDGPSVPKPLASREAWEIDKIAGWSSPVSALQPWHVGFVEIGPSSLHQYIV